MDGLATPETDGLAGEPHRLVLATDEVHLDAAFIVIPNRAMGERRHVEVGASLTIQPHQDVAVERGGDAGRVVVGR